MGSPTVFSGKYTKLLTQRGLMQQGGAVNQFDGPRNYIKNSTFENGTDDGWNRVSTSMSGNLPTGAAVIGKSAGIAPTIGLFGVSLGGGLFDSNGFWFGNAISTVTAGQGIISDAFTVEPGDLGKVLTFKLYYKSVFGASTDNWSGILGSQTWGVYIYDDSAGAWLQPAGFLGMNQNSGVGVVSGTFQSSVVASQRYRIAIIALKTTTSVSVLTIDNISVGSQTAPIGPVVTDWVSYLPTVGNLNAGTTPNQFYRWRRVGDSIQIMGNITAGGAGIGISGDVTISLPSGLSFDTTKLAIVSETAIGTGSLHDTGVGRYPCSVNAGGSNFFVLVVRANAATGGNVVSNNFPSAGWYNAAGDSISFELMAPVAGWSSSVQMSNDTDTRVVAFRGTRTTTQSFPNVAYTPVQYDSIRTDTHGAWDAVNYLYRVPVGGNYEIYGSFLLQFGSTTAELVAGLWVDGVQVALQQNFKAAALGGNLGLTYNFLRTLNAGQTIQIRCYQVNSGGGPISGVFESAGIEHGALYINRLSGPSVVAASETVAEIRQNTAGSIIGTTATKIPYPTTIKSTHNAWDSVNSRFTAPVSGTYFVSFLYAHVAVGLSRPFEIYFTKSGGGFGGSFANRAPTAATTDGAYGDRNAACINSLVSLNAGEFIEFYSLSPNGSVALFTSVSTNLISIVRVGN
jgi:hypothetical protein